MLTDPLATTYTNVLSKASVFPYSNLAFPQEPGGSSEVANASQGHTAEEDVRVQAEEAQKAKKTSGMCLPESHKRAEEHRLCPTRLRKSSKILQK